MTLISLSLFLTGCASSVNHDIAKYQRVDTGNRITMTGERENMAHDPISFIFRGTLPSKLVLVVPRIDGEIIGSEIPTKKGYYKYAGVIKFQKNVMLLSLSYDNTDKDVKKPISWNGKYKLEPEK